jgi:hypothetical protein
MLAEQLDHGSDVDGKREDGQSLYLDVSVTAGRSSRVGDIESWGVIMMS